MDGRVSVRDTGGRTRVLRDDLPCANGITVHQGRLFIGECRDGGRLMELDLDGGAPRILLENLPSPNAMEVGPDGLLYFPVMTANEIWRIDPDGGEPQRVAGDLGVPDAVKFDADGYIVSTQVASGQVLRIDPRNGEQTVLAQLNPGLDNLTFADGRLFVSNFTGEITEILGGGDTRTVLPGGLNWPLDLAVGDDGRLYVADGTYFYVVAPDGVAADRRACCSRPGYPGFLRGLAPAGPGEFVVTTSGGQVARYRPGGERNRLPGRRIRPALRRGDRARRGDRVRRTGHRAGARAAVGQRRECWRPDCATRSASRSTRTAACWSPSPARAGWCGWPASGTETVVDGLQRPQGILVRDGRLYIVDAGAKEVVAFDLNSKARSTIAVGPAGRAPARRRAQAAQGHAAVLRAAGTVRRHRRGTRRHAVRLGRRRRQRVCAAC